MVRFAGFLALGALLLWGGTGQPFGEPPVVVIESGSMMHCGGELGRSQQGDSCEQNRFGRLGTIDPGDLVFVRDIDERADVSSMAAEENRHHGEAGDVIVFQPNGNADRIPVIHRAMFWVEVHEDGTLSIEELGLTRIGTDELSNPAIKDAQRFGLSGFCQLNLPRNMEPDDSGFITKGDNNNCWDQAGGSHAVSTHPIKPDWILGKARGEVPWLGMLKLWTFDLLNGGSNYAAAPADLRRAMWLSLVVLIGSPYLVEFAANKIRDRRESSGGGDASADADSASANQIQQEPDGEKKLE